MIQLSPVICTSQQVHASLMHFVAGYLDTMAFYLVVHIDNVIYNKGNYSDTGSLCTMSLHTSQNKSVQASRS